MEFRSLRYFAVTAEEGHITRAAERLDMQQPPLSRQIKALERELGVQLFRRKARGVELTDAGNTLLQASRDILPRVQRAIEATQRTAQGEQGQVRIGAAPTAPFHSFVPRVIRAFRETFPRVTLTLEESLSNDLFQRLRDDEIDIAFYRSAPADGAGLKLDPLLHEPMIMAVPKGNPLAKSVGGRDCPCAPSRTRHSSSTGAAWDRGCTTRRSPPVKSRDSVLGSVRRHRASFRL